MQSPAFTVVFLWDAKWMKITLFRTHFVDHYSFIGTLLDLNRLLVSNLLTTVPGNQPLRHQ